MIADVIVATIAAVTVWHHGVASVYDSTPQTASGRHAPLMVAHRHLPFGTRVRFLYRGRKVDALVLDRGPYITGRMWDLNYATARALGFPIGVADLKWRIVRR